MSNNITIVLEDIYQIQNSSTILRTMELIGLKEIHVIQVRNKFVFDTRISLGAERKLKINYYKSAKDCLKYLKENGYTLVATSPHKENFTPETLPYYEKLALVMGTEEQGLTSEFLKSADSFLRIPMFGFTESLNVAVSASIIIFELQKRFKKVA